MLDTEAAQEQIKHGTRKRSGRSGRRTSVSPAHAAAASAASASDGAGVLSQLYNLTHKLSCRIVASATDLGRASASRQVPTEQTAAVEHAAPWTQFSPSSGSHRRVRYASVLSLVLLIIFFVCAWLAYNTRSSSGERLPMALIICRGKQSLVSEVLFIAGVAMPAVLVTLALSVYNNVNWSGIWYLGAAYNVWFVLLQTVIRTIVYTGAYAHTPVLPQAANLSAAAVTNATGLGCVLDSTQLQLVNDALTAGAEGQLLGATFTTGLNSTGANEFDFDERGCGIAVGMYSFTHLLLLCSYMLSDLFKCRAPFMRLCLACVIAILMYLEIQARSAGPLLPNEQEPPTRWELLNALLGGATTQTFILALDRSVLTLMIAGFASTLLRPDFCAFILLPATVPDAMFYYDADRKNRTLLGARRRDRLLGLPTRVRAMQLRLARRFPCLRPLCCGVGNIKPAMPVSDSMHYSIAERYSSVVADNKERSSSATAEEVRRSRSLQASTNAAAAGGGAPAGGAKGRRGRRRSLADGLFARKNGSAGRKSSQSTESGRSGRSEVSGSARGEASTGSVASSSGGDFAAARASKAECRASQMLLAAGAAPDGAPRASKMRPAAEPPAEATPLPGTPLRVSVASAPGPAGATVTEVSTAGALRPVGPSRPLFGGRTKSGLTPTRKSRVARAIQRARGRSTEPQAGRACGPAVPSGPAVLSAAPAMATEREADEPRAADAATADEREPSPPPAEPARRSEVSNERPERTISDHGWAI